jgi:hypothetical protein
MCFISNLRSISQAGRRGFDPRLPLFVFSGLQAICCVCVILNYPFKNLIASKSLRSGLLQALPFTHLRAQPSLLCKDGRPVPLG